MAEPRDPSPSTPDGNPPSTVDRRRFLIRSGVVLAGLSLRGPLAGAATTAAASSPGTPSRFAVLRTDRPTLPNGIMSGDVNGPSAVVWARADRPAKVRIDWSTTAGFDEVHTLRPIEVGAASDFTAKAYLERLPMGQRIFYRVQVEDLADASRNSAPEIGSFLTPSSGDRDVSFVFTGDCAGQGWGINPEWGGMRCFETMRRSEPDFFIHSGDTIYADGVIKAEVPLADGTVWKNVTTPEKSKVAETLAEFRGAFRYNLLDENVRRFNASVPTLAQWDDHEVVNNWYPGEVLDYRSGEYTSVQQVEQLAARAKQAFFEYFPIRPGAEEEGRVYRKISYGPLLDVFMLDMRSYRSPNNTNDQTALGADAAILGQRQLDWLKEGLASSRATWKAVAADMPIGLVVTDYAEGANPHYPGGKGPGWYEAVSNGDNGAPKGRELEIADLLSFLKRRQVRNVVWFTADVHYTAAHYYDPSRAAFSDFDPFWEFVAGPVNAGTFGPNKLDATFGPEVRFVKAPPAGQVNLPPSAGYQFFGKATIDCASQAMTVALIDVFGTTLWETEIAPQS